MENNRSLTGGVSRFGLFWSVSLKSFPKGRYPDSLVAVSSAVNGASRLQYGNPRQRNCRREGGITQSTLSQQEMNQAAAPLVYTNTESLFARL